MDQNQKALSRAGWGQKSRTPAHGVKAHVNVKHAGHCLRSRGGRRGRGGSGIRRGVGLEDGTNHKEQGTHAEGRNDQGESAAQTLDAEEDEDGGGDNLGAG